MDSSSARSWLVRPVVRIAYGGSCADGTSVESCVCEKHEQQRQTLRVFSELPFLQAQTTSLKILQHGICSIAQPKLGIQRPASKSSILNA